MPLLPVNLLQSQLSRPARTAFVPVLIFLFAFSPCTALGARSSLPFGHVPSSFTPFAVLTVQERLSEQNTIFSQQYQDDLKASPEGKTAVGDYSDNARLDDYSLAASARQDATDRAYLEKIEAISDEDFPEQDRISHDLFIRVLEERIVDYGLKKY
jgi:hypothetical protein